MIVVLKAHTPGEAIDDVEAHVVELGYVPHTIRGEVRTIVACVGDETTHADLHALEAHSAVDRVVAIQKRFKLVSREARGGTHIIRVGEHEIGGDTFHVFAGSCAVESYEQMQASARASKASGATILRGGAFKPRTSPYDFQGLGQEGLDILATVGREFNMPVVSEVLRVSDIDAMVESVDIMQIGARNGMNYALLEAVAKAGKPVFLKRGLAATIDEWILAAEYLAKNGNGDVILCERGIRTFETTTRNTLDVGAVCYARKETSLPVFTDPSHAAGRRDLIAAMSCASVAAGANGLMIEVHHCPEDALSDQQQQLPPEMFAELMDAIRPYVATAGLKIADPVTVAN